MKRKAFKNVFLLGLLFTQLMSAQYLAQKKGDRFFGLFAYAKAIEQYEIMLSEEYKTVYAHKQLAECYLLMRNYDKAIPHFEAVIQTESVPKDYYFKYAMALYSVGQKDKASFWLRKYKKYVKNDSRVNRFLKDGNLASVVFNSRERYAVESTPINTSESDFGAFVFQDTLYFASARRDLVDGDEYGWNGEPWLDIFKVPEDNLRAIPRSVGEKINTKFHESSPIFTTDYKKDTVIYFTRNSFMKNKKEYGQKDELNLKIYKAEYRKGEWTVTKSLSINSNDFSTGHPFVSPDGRRLYFTSDRPGGLGGTDIWYSEIHARGGIGYPKNAGPVVNTEGNEMFPFINEEGNLIFSSDGHVGFGMLDIFSTVVNEHGDFTDVINLGTPINSSKDDFAYYADTHGINGYISSNRDSGEGSDDIYKFRFTPSLAVEGYVYDDINDKPLDSVRIRILDQKTNTLVAETITDENGYYHSYIDRQTNYLIEAERRTHPTKFVYFNTFKTPITTKIINQNLRLEPVLDVKLLAGLNKIYFDFNKSDIRPDAAVELDKVVKLMTETYPEMIIRLESHTDPVGGVAYNDRLSESRAKSTYQYLIRKGVPKEHILSYKGFGERKPVNECTSKYDCSPEELELNRRTEFPVVQIRAKRNKVAK